MAIELKMPALSPTMETGTLAKWLVAEGDMIKPGDLIAEIETDKATMEFEAIDEGRIVSLIVPEGTDDVVVGTVIALLAEDGDETPQMATAPRGAVPASLPELLRDFKTTPTPAPSPIPAVALESGIDATPLARRIAAAEGISLGAIKGSGPRGRIVKADLDLPPLLAPTATVSGALLAPAVAPPPAGVPVETVKLSNMRRTIARRLAESKQTVPHFYLTARCNLDALLKLRSELNTGLDARGIKLSVNDMLIKAMALALIAVPDANVQFGGEELHRFGRVDISLAVAIEGGLVTPVIEDVGSLSLSGIAQATKALAAKARDGKLTPEDYRGGTASISNLGMFGIDEIFPVINPPQALILGIGAGVAQPWNVDGAMALATIMAATASFDHRAIDGAVAAQFMAAFREFVEAPMQIIT